MQYFKTLPLITQKDINNNNITVNNIISRAYLVPSLFKNIMLFYDYDVREGDTPETITYKYYNDVNKFWILLYSNNILDIQESWPLGERDFNSYIISKYKDQAPDANAVIEYTQSTSHHYEQIVTTTNNDSFLGQTITFWIDEDTYDTLVEESVTSFFNNSSKSVTKKTEKRNISIYDYEKQLNESHRTIQVMNSNYINQTESEFASLMRK